MVYQTVCGLKWLPLSNCIARWLPCNRYTQTQINISSRGKLNIRKHFWNNEPIFSFIADLIVVIWHSFGKTEPSTSSMSNHHVGHTGDTGDRWIVCYSKLVNDRFTYRIHKVNDSANYPNSWWRRYIPYRLFKTNEWSVNYPRPIRALGYCHALRRLSVHPALVTTLQPTIFCGSGSHLAQPLTLLWKWTLSISGLICSFLYDPVALWNFTNTLTDLLLGLCRPRVPVLWTVFFLFYYTNRLITGNISCIAYHPF